MAKKITITRLATMRRTWLSSAKRLPRNSGMVSESLYCSVCARSRGATSTQFAQAPRNRPIAIRSEEHTSELQSLMRISYAVFCLKKKNQNHRYYTHSEVTSNYPILTG